ncbi:hypothetical protein Tco_1042291 [Tanacetum coccineum]|uniref:Uncharacterized protein n=1 Tax=Tanacetum coccineum TaxID=301880 RepID=A0ABQ5GK34_9ASTR
MVSVPIHQDTSSVPPMTTPVIDLMKSQSDSSLPTLTTTTSTITTTTTLPPPPLQSTTDPILVRRIGELEQHITDLIQNNLALEESLDKHGSRLYKLENLSIPHQVSKVVDEIRMFKDNTYKTHEVHNDLYEALQKSVELDYSNQPDIPEAQELAPSDYLMQDDSIPEEQVLLSDDEDSKNDHQPKADLRKDWWKPLPEEERPVTPEPAWTIPSSNKSDVVNNWASALATTYEPPAENSLLAKIGEMTTFMNWYCQKIKECHKMLTAHVDWTNPEGDQVKIDVNQPLPLGGPPGHVTIQPQFFFNKDLEYLRYDSKGSNPALSISKMKAASYLDGLNY